MSEPRVTEIRVHWGGEGKVQLEDFGKQASGYGCNVSRTIEIPEDWTTEQVAKLERQVIDEIKAQLEPILAAEHEERMVAREEIASSQ